MKLTKILITDSSKTTILIRLMVGAVFLSEGIQKFLYPDLRGAGRFEKIELPSPDFLGNLVGLFEVLAGALILVGLLTRIAAVPTLIIMLVAIATTNQLFCRRKDFGLCFMAAGQIGRCCWAQYSY